MVKCLETFATPATSVTKLESSNFVFSDKLWIFLKRIPKTNFWLKYCAKSHRKGQCRYLIRRLCLKTKIILIQICHIRVMTSCYFLTTITCHSQYLHYHCSRTNFIPALSCNIDHLLVKNSHETLNIHN